MPEVELFNHQIEFITSYAPTTGLIAGFGAGKSFVATVKCVERLKEFPDYNIGYYLPTYNLIKSIAFENFKMYLDLQGIDYKLHETDKVFQTSIGNIWMRSMDNPSLIVGYETAYAVIDEADVLPKDKTEKAFKAIVARNRQTLPDGHYNSVDMVSTPEGFKFLHDYFVTNGSERRKLIQANTLDNTTLPQSYIDNLYDTYPEKQLDAYMRGQFVNLTSGTVYHAFNRNQHYTDLEIKPKETLFVGMDFNIEKMAAVVFVIRQGVVYALKEYCNVYDTFQMIDLINEDFERHPKIVFPDASGKNRNSSGKTDHQALKKARFQVQAPPANPPIRDRVNTMNLAFQKNKLFVNVKNCPTFVEALEQQAYDKNGQPDKSTGHDHVNDAGGYGVHSIFARKKLVRL